MTDEELNEKTLKLLGWRWEPCTTENADGKVAPIPNGGGNLYTPDGERYRFALNEVTAWNIEAPQIVRDWCAAGRMLSGYDYELSHHQYSDSYSIYLRFDTGTKGIDLDRHTASGRADTFPRAACLAVLAMLSEKAVGVS